MESGQKQDRTASELEPGPWSRGGGTNCQESNGGTLRRTSCESHSWISCSTDLSLFSLSLYNEAVGVDVILGQTKMPYRFSAQDGLSGGCFLLNGNQIS